MPRPRSETARKNVLRATRELVERDGYEATSIEGIAAAAGVSKQTIYRWWPSKSAILGEAILESPEDPMPQMLADSDDLEADLHDWLATSRAYLEEPRNAALARALIAVTATDPELGAALNRRLAGPLVAAVTDRLERAATAGQVAQDVDAGAFADLFVAASAYAALTGRGLDEASVTHTVRLLLSGIRAR